MSIVSKLRATLAGLAGRSGSPPSPRHPQLAAFQAEVSAACESCDARALQALAARQTELGLGDDEVAVERELIEATRGLLRLRAFVENSGALPEVETQHRIIGTDTCHFLAPACRDEHELTPPGKLFLTSRRLIYAGPATLSVPWHEVTAVRRAGFELVCNRRGAPVLRLRCSSFADVMQAVYVAEWLTEWHQERKPRAPENGELGTV